jgi:DNA repair protein RecO (recombination protein O)
LKQTTKGIFIHRSAYAESSFIGVFYTEQSGLQRFLFQGGKKKASGLFPCAICELTYYKRPESDLSRLTEVAPLHMCKNLNTNPIYSTVAFFFAEIIRNVIRAEQQDEDMYGFLTTVIQLLDEAEQEELSELTIRILLKLCGKTGIEPQTEESIKAYFIPQEGLFTDVEQGALLRYGGEGVQLIQSILLGNPTDAFSLKSKREALSILMVYLEFHIPNFKANRTLEIIKEILYA